MRYSSIISQILNTQATISAVIETCISPPNSKPKQTISQHRVSGCAPKEDLTKLHERLHISFDLRAAQFVFVALFFAHKCKHSIQTGALATSMQEERLHRRAGEEGADWASRSHVNKADVLLASLAMQ